ncbi:hypothetical protein KIW84_031049 [Lathyrus oleraceus]|uniref:Glutaredoxin domain-containing protein n=1 Tax=Pisum sativum TaxID=3888 RepID=A0A9D4XQ68_PEA|nr:hypothetical protein KIW84_031049 [Pisum sativum]
MKEIANIREKLSRLANDKKGDNNLKNPHISSREDDRTIHNGTHGEARTTDPCLASDLLDYLNTLTHEDTIASRLDYLNTLTHEDTIATKREKPVVIFSKSTCCLSHSVTSLIRSFGANPIVYELDKITNGSQIESELLQMGCKPSVPAVFIGQQFRGGSKKIMSLHVRNELVPMLKEAGAIWI